MRNKGKSFDCIAMKRQIQDKLSAEFAGLSAEERMAAMEKRIMAGPFAEIWAARKLAGAERENVA